MKTQETTANVTRTQSIWLYREKLQAWLIIFLGVCIMLSSMFRSIGRVTWVVAFAIVPLLVIFLSPSVLKKVNVSESSVTVTRFKKTYVNFSEGFTVGIFERRTARRVLPYMYVAREGFEVTDNFLRTVKKCDDDFIFFSLGVTVGAKLLSALPKNFTICGESDVNEKNKKILESAKKQADILRSSIDCANNG